MATLCKQIVKTAEDEAGIPLLSDENVKYFLQTQSKYGKNFKEIELTYETSTCKIYTVMNSEDEIAIKIPKPVHEGDKKGHLDLIFET